ncbi:MAG TPA: mannose-1-phosphate guanylyltransferase/mannose-6-phosphate isomerase [Asticcacaulis sp.]|nr:mannose-1-phosphate guanylyltransferase/mannose-6-phosphate isomerase [Asticcacaulis sp.]
MSFKILPVIMSGGSGTRLWPLSTGEAPKQFHALATNNTMIQETALRLGGGNFLAPVVICGRGHLDLAMRQLDLVGRAPQAVVLEPMARNTAAVAALAALSGLHLVPDALVLLAPADHVITNPDAFQAAIARAAETATSRIVTFGIHPSHPETGFGYIEHGPRLADGVFCIKRFCEKPDTETAKSYVESGNYDWNAGIFLFSPQVMLDELQIHAPDVLEHAREAFQKAQRDGVVISLDDHAFARVPSISVDYAVMEKTQASAVVPCDIGWADVGGFAELWRLGEKDGAENHVKGDAILIEAQNCLVHNSGPVVAVIGLENIMVISTPSGVLVAPITRAQDVKKAAEAAKARLAALVSSQ